MILDEGASVWEEGGGSGGEEISWSSRDPPPGRRPGGGQTSRWCRGLVEDSWLVSHGPAPENRTTPPPFCADKRERIKSKFHIVGGFQIRTTSCLRNGANGSCLIKINLIRFGGKFR